MAPSYDKHRRDTVRGKRDIAVGVVDHGSGDGPCLRRCEERVTRKEGRVGHRRAHVPCDDAREAVERLKTRNAAMLLQRGRWGLVGCRATWTEQIQDACFERRVEAIVVHQMLECRDR